MYLLFINPQRVLYRATFRTIHSLLVTIHNLKIKNKDVEIHWSKTRKILNCIISRKLTRNQSVTVVCLGKVNSRKIMTKIDSNLHYKREMENYRKP